MSSVVSLLVLGVGVVLIVSMAVARIIPSQEFPRFGAPIALSRRVWPLTLGVVIALAGLAMLLLSRGGSS